MTSPQHLRLKRLRLIMAAENIDALLVSKRENIAYLSDFYQIHPTNREALLFITDHQALLYHSVFFKPKIIDEITTQPMDANHPLASIIQTLFPVKTRLGFEGHDLHVNEYDRYHQYPQLDLIPTNNLIETMRLVKDDAEIKPIIKSCTIASKVSHQLKSMVYAGITEIQLARQIENAICDYGAQSVSFPTIVAFGSHSASPHHAPTTSKLKNGDVVLVDFGCMVDGYCSDTTSTFAFNTPPSRFLEIQKVVQEAYKAALDTLRTQFTVTELTNHSKSYPTSSISHPESKLTAASLDRSARSVIQAAGLGEKFIHTTGHGLGLEIHEPPSLNLNNQTLLEKNMVITLEPGIYLPGHFGYRYENTVILL